MASDWEHPADRDDWQRSWRPEDDEPWTPGGGAGDDPGPFDRVDEPWLPEQELVTAETLRAIVEAPPEEREDALHRVMTLFWQSHSLGRHGPPRSGMTEPSAQLWDALWYWTTVSTIGHQLLACGITDERFDELRASLRAIGLHRHLAVLEEAAACFGDRRIVAFDLELPLLPEERETLARCDAVVRELDTVFVERAHAHVRRHISEMSLDFY